MTTIAYSHKHKQIAVDGRVTSDGLICSDKSVKYIERNDQVFFYTSKGDDGIHLVDVYFGAEPLKENYEATVMFTCDGVVFLMTYTNGELSQWSVVDDTAMGSGGDFALAAMDFGEGARGAVEYAATRDVFTGGEIAVFDV